MMILLDQSTGLAVNSEDISWIRLDRPPIHQPLTVVMRGDAELIVKSRPNSTNKSGLDTLEVHRRILEAK
jgi:hypothetical protein